MFHMFHVSPKISLTLLYIARQKMAWQGLRNMLSKQVPVWDFADKFSIRLSTQLTAQITGIVSQHNLSKYLAYFSGQQI